jgi:hypothetical protein
MGPSRLAAAKVGKKSEKRKRKSEKFAAIKENYYLCIQISTLNS